MKHGKIGRKTAITLFSCYGDVTVFDSIDDAKAKLGMRFIRRYVGPHFRSGTYDQHRSNVYAIAVDFEYVMRNDFGEVVMPEDFKFAGNRRNLAKSKGVNHGVPVQGAGRSTRGQYFRSISTANEKRCAQVVDEYEPSIRAARKPGSLPSDRSDIGVVSRLDRSWKGFRKNRWK